MNLFDTRPDEADTMPANPYTSAKMRLRLLRDFLADVFATCICDLDYEGGDHCDEIESVWYIRDSILEYVGASFESAQVLPVLDMLRTEHNARADRDRPVDTRSFYRKLAKLAEPYVIGMVVSASQSRTIHPEAFWTPEKLSDPETDAIDEQKIEAIAMGLRHGTNDGAHHKMWVIDQMIRILTGCPIVDKQAVDARGKVYTFKALGESEEYKRLITEYCDGEDGPETYSWDVGIPP